MKLEAIKKPKGITSITYVRNIGSTPARVNRKTGELQINLDVWPKLKPEHKRFVLLHEEGHVVLDTSDELAVDEYAFKKYAAEGYSLTESVKAITRLLNNDNPQHNLRAQLQLQRAKEYDHFVNKNNRIILNNQSMTKLLSPTEQYLNEFSNSYDSLFGIALSKKAKERKQQKFDAKLAKKAAKTSLIQARADAKVNKSEAKLQLAQQGIAEPSAGSVIASTVSNLAPAVASIATGGVIGNILGGGGVNAPAEIMNANPLPTTQGLIADSMPTPIYGNTSNPYLPKSEDPKKSSLVIVGIITAVVVVGLILFSVMKNRK